MRRLRLGLRLQRAWPLLVGQVRCVRLGLGLLNGALFERTLRRLWLGLGLPWQRPLLQRSLWRLRLGFRLQSGPLLVGQVRRLRLGLGLQRRALLGRTLQQLFD